MTKGDLVHNPQSRFHSEGVAAGVDGGAPSPNSGKVGASVMLNSGAGEGCDFATFLDVDAIRLRRALSARFGTDVGAEATQDALAYGWEHWERVGQMANPVGYLFRVGQSSARTYQRRRLNLHFPVEAPADAPRIEPGLESALTHLTDRQRVAVLLVHAWGYRYAEAAQVMDVSTDAVRNHVHRGLKRLRRNLHIPPDGEENR